MHSSSPSGERHDALPLPSEPSGFTSNAAAAAHWSNFGLAVLPLLPHDLSPAVEQKSWFKELSSATIAAHWQAHPDHAVGCVLGTNLVVVAAPSSDGEAALREIEKNYYAAPFLQINADSGFQHYFHLPQEVHVPPTARCPTPGPRQIGVFTAGDLMVLPPSGNCVLHHQHAACVSNLADAEQEFIDAVARHNEGATPPAPALPCLPESKEDAPQPQESACVAGADERLAGSHSNASPTSIEHTLVEPLPGDAPNRDAAPSPLTQYSLLGHVEELERLRVEQTAFLGSIGLLGQATVIYAKANTGKTLIVLHLIIDAIKRGLIDPSKLIYVNMDDNSSGLVEKVRLAEEFGFHMVADGHRDFDAKALHREIVNMVATSTVGGTIIVLDTLKKFVNTMDKAQSTEFAKVIRQFVLKGGTVVALSHANKNPGADGKTVYSGTTDIVDDFDCAYTVTEVAQQVDPKQRVVEFTNIKRRGNVALSAAYSYALERDITYNELLLSVCEVDPDQLEQRKQAADAVSDAEVIDTVVACIQEGIDNKMALVAAVAERAEVNKRAALRVIEKYTGNDPTKHLWSFVVRARGAKVFTLLERPSAPDADRGRS